MTFPFFVCAVSEKTIQSAPQPFNPQFRPFTANHLAKPHFHAILPRVCQAPSSPASCRAPICASCQSLALPLSTDWRTPSPPFYPAPQRGLRGLCLSHWPELANRSELFNSSSVIVPFPIRSFNRRSRPCRDCRLSTSSAPLPHIHKSLPTPALSPLSATLMGSPRMCCKQKTYSNAKPFRCNIYAKPGGGAFFPFWNYSSAVTEHGSRITHRRPAPILSGSPVMRSSVKAILLLFLHKTYNLQLKTETSLRVHRLQLGIHQERIIELRHFTPALAQNRKEARRKRFVPFHG